MEVLDTKKMILNTQTLSVFLAKLISLAIRIISECREMSLVVLEISGIHSITVKFILFNLILKLILVMDSKVLKILLLTEHKDHIRMPKLIG